MLKTLSVTCLSFLMLVSRFGNILCNGDDEHSIMKPVRHAERINVNTGYIKYAKETQGGAQGVPVLFRDQQKQISLTNELLTATDTEGFPYFITEPCLNHTKLFLEALIYGETWALQMIDSMGKPPSGISTGKLVWLGDWEQCVGIQPMAYENFTTREDPYSAYKTKYCLASFKIDSKTAASLLTQNPSINVGMCFPESCTAWDTAQLAHMFLELLPVNASNLPFPQMSCQENKLEYSGKAIAVIVVCSLFLTVMLAATVYDVIIVFYLNRAPNEYVQLPGTVEPKRHQPSNGHLPATGQPHANGHTSSTGQPPAKGPLPANENGPVVDESTILLSSSYKHNILSHDRNDMEKVKPVNYEPGVFGKALLSFSVYSNAKKILSTSQPSGTLTCVNGIRFISMTWVILGHTYAFGLQVTDNMGQFFMEVIQRFTFQAISNATVAVDTFFVLSGLLVAFLSLREMDKRQGAKKFNWFMYYFHRFWRLTPPYMLFLMFYVPLFKHFGDGPIWLQNGPEVNECNETWWTNLLYVNNLVKTDKMVMDRDAKLMRQEGPTIFAQARHMKGVPEIADLILKAHKEATGKR